MEAPVGRPVELEREADAALAAAPAELPPPSEAPPPGGPEPSFADIVAGYQVLAEPILAGSFNAACPAWEITAAERGKLAGALAQAAALWFPQGLPPKWAALIVVAGVGYEIVSARVVVTAEGQKRLKPLRLPAPDAQPEKPAGDPHAPIN